MFAAGVLMWEMYHGSRAWAGMSLVQVIYAPCPAEFIPLDNLTDDVDAIHSTSCSSSSVKVWHI